MRLALDGVQVIDLTRNLAGPYCTQILAELGADVTKIERPEGGDDTRHWAPSARGTSPMFEAANRSKRSVAVDLDDPRGQEIIRRLARDADVIVETFRPGALDRRGLGWGDLREVNDQLIYCSISAYGQSGPRAGQAGYDPVVQAASGIMSITGEPDGPPVRLGISALDLGSGVWAVVGILHALRSRDQTGKGCRVDTSLFETASWWLSYHLALYFATGVVPTRLGSASPVIAPYEALPTAEGHLFIAAGNDHLFRVVCEILALDDLPADPRFTTNTDRVANREQLAELLTVGLASAPADVWEARLQERGVPCSRLATVADLASDPQLLALDMLCSKNGSQCVLSPLAFDSERPQPRSSPPRLGADTESVVRRLGYTETDLEDLLRDGVIAT